MLQDCSSFPNAAATSTPRPSSDVQAACSTDERLCGALLGLGGLRTPGSIPAGVLVYPGRVPILRFHVESPRVHGHVATEW